MLGLFGNLGEGLLWGHFVRLVSPTTLSPLCPLRWPTARRLGLPRALWLVLPGALSLSRRGFTNFGVFVILAVLFYTMAWAASSSGLIQMLGHFGSQGDGLLWGPLRLLPGGGGPKPRTSAMLFFLGWKLGASPSAVLGAWCSACSLRYCFSTVGDLAGLLGQLVATPFGFGGAACSYFDDFDPFIVDLDGYS